MPLYMDLHKASDYDRKPTVEEIKKNHIADLAVQYKYGVRFLQYWINEEAGMVFCLMEAPDKEACAAVHAEAHGAMPCNIIALQGGDYQVFMNEGTHKNQFDIVENSNGTLDGGYRTVMVVDLLCMTDRDQRMDSVVCHIRDAGGSILQRPDYRLTGIFTTLDAATEAALAVRDAMQQLPYTELRIGISTGLPVGDGPDLFADAIALSHRLCDIALAGKVVMSCSFRQIGSRTAPPPHGHTCFRTLTAENERFLNSLMPTFDSSPADSIHVAYLATLLGTSRSQLNRKMKELTELSPNAFMQERKLRKAAQLMQQEYGNVTQVAFKAGFGNLSYFARSFQGRFGIPPFKYSRGH